MTEAGNKGPELCARLPRVRGSMEAGQDLARLTWFRTGGPAEFLFTPADEADLAGFLRQTDHDIPVCVIGLGSNLLVRDGGIPGVVVRLGAAFSHVRLEPDHKLRAGAAIPDVKVAHAALKAGLWGLTFFRGIPGTIGGALRMNGGAYGRETADVLVSAAALDRNGKRHEVSAREMGFSYRHSAVPEDWIFTEAVFQGTPGDVDIIAQEMKEISAAREATQPVRSRTGGSTFKNPAQARAWQLIEQAGCRGLAVGPAHVSEKHCNFLINEGGATARDLETLGENVRERVRAKTGVDLEWEIRRVGIDGTREDEG